MTTTISSYEQQAIDFLAASNVSIKWEYLKFGKHFSDDTQARNIFMWTLTKNGQSIGGTFGSSINDSCKATPKLQSNEPVSIYWGIEFSGFTEGAKKIPSLIFSYSIETSCEILGKVKAGNIDPESLINDQHFIDKYTDFSVKYKQSRRKELGGPLSSLDAAKRSFIKKISAKIEELESETVLLDQADQIIEPSAYDLLSCLTKYDPGTFDNFCDDFGYDKDSRRAEKTYNSVVNEWNNVSGFFTPEEIEQLQEIN